MSVNVVDTINEKMYEDFKKFLKELRRLVMELYRAKNERERQAALQQILGEIERADKILDEKLDLIKQKNNELNEKQAELDKLKENIPQETEEKAPTWSEILPDTYEEMRQEIIDNTKDNFDDLHKQAKSDITRIADRQNVSEEYKEQFIINKLNEIDVNKATQNTALNNLMYKFFRGYENNEDWKEFLTQYLDTQYTDANITEYTEENGTINYYDLMNETEIKDDVFIPLLTDISQNQETTKELRDYMNKLKAEHGDLDTMIDNIDNDSKAAVIINNEISTDDLDL